MKIRHFFIIGIAIFLSGCDYTIMKKEDRAKLILTAMVEGYKIGNADCSDKIIDYHLRDINYER